ncbi:MAG: hypothetical protein L3J36_14325 [Rhodobacteraceae bacterium]|nr:hypothetical protein [Paracoccaceae bacterium]
MWKPPQKIRWTTGKGVVPDAATLRSSRLFAPLRVGRLTLETRTWVPAMVPWRADEQGFVTDNVLDWYGRFAKGRPAAIVVEATGIRDVPSGPLLRVGHDRFIPGLEKLVGRVRDESQGHTRLFIQLIDFLAIRRRPARDKFLNRFLVITPAHRENLDLPETTPDPDVRALLGGLDEDALKEVLTPREWQDLTTGARERVTDTHLPHIRDLPETLPDLFAKAALRTQQAGFDGVELHYAHAYTMASFLSATNTRSDGFGGTAKNRVKLPLEVFHKVRKTVEQDFVVGARILADEIVDGGSTAQDVQWFALEFARAGMDFLSLSRGGKFDDAKQPKMGDAAYPYTGQSGYECMPQFLSDEFGPFGRNFAATKAIRTALKKAGHHMPIVAAGGIHNFETAEGALQDEVADIIGTARQSLADPDWIEKLAAGQNDQIRTCEYTNYCEGLDQKHKQVTCKLWDRSELDKDGVALSVDGKRRLIAPAWDAG